MYLLLMSASQAKEKAGRARGLILDSFFESTLWNINIFYGGSSFSLFYIIYENYFSLSYLR